MKKKWMKVFIVSYVFSMYGIFLMPSNAYAEEGELAWSRVISGNGRDHFRDVKQTKDGGYIAAGYTTSSTGDITVNKGGEDALLVKVNAAGEVSWIKTIGGSGSEIFISVQQTSDGGYIAAGYSDSANGDITGARGLYDAIIFKFDSSGNVVWKKNIGGTNNDFFTSVQQTSDGGYIAGGYSESNDGDLAYKNKGSNDFMFVKFNASGTVTWVKTVGGSQNDILYSIQQTTDGGYIAAGYTNSNDGDLIGSKGLYDAVIVKLDTNGNVTWVRKIGGSQNDHFRSVQQTTDGGYIAAGYSTSNNTGDVAANKGSNDALIVKFDSSGNTTWVKTIGGSGADTFHSVKQTPDGHYIAVGESNSPSGDIQNPRGLYDGIIVNFESNGDISWIQNIGGSQNDYIHSVAITADGDYIVAGYSNSPDGDFTISKSAYAAFITKYAYEKPVQDSTVAHVGISAGSLSLTTPTIQSSFNNVVLNGQSNTVRATLTSFDVSDFTAKGEGWQVIVQASTFMEKAPDGTWDTEGTRLSLPTGVLALQPVNSIVITAGSSQPPTSSLSAKTAIDTGGAIKLISAGVGKGQGGYTVDFPVNALELTLPANIKTDLINYPSSPTIYESSITWTIVTGP